MPPDLAPLLADLRQQGARRFAPWDATLLDAAGARAALTLAGGLRRHRPRPAPPARRLPARPVAPGRAQRLVCAGPPLVGPANRRAAAPPAQERNARADAGIGALRRDGRGAHRHL